MKVIASIKSFLKDEEGASGIEYALLAVMVAVVLGAFTTGSTSIPTKIRATFNSILSALTTS